MTKILYIKSSPLPDEQSKSTNIANVFLDEYLTTHPNDEVVTLNLYDMNIPFIDADVLKGRMKLSQSFPLTKNELTKIEAMNSLLNQFIEADKYIFVSPLWNLGMPPVLKAYFDIITAAGKTFKYTENGSVGLLENKLAIHIHGCGGIYSDGKVKQYADPYVRGILEFLGVRVLPTIFVEGIDYNPEKRDNIINQAKEQAKKLAHCFEVNNITC